MRVVRRRHALGHNRPHVQDVAAGAVTREPKVALLVNVQVQASACVDEVAFTFLGGLPSFTAGCRDGPFTEDPSDRPMDVAGTAHLAVRFDPASAFDLASDDAHQHDDGPNAMRPPAPSGIADLQRIGDFEAVLSWVAGVAERRPFEVVTRDDQLVVQLPAPAPRETRCPAEGGGFTVGYPPTWFVELSDRWACRYFHADPFVIYPGTNDIRSSVTVQRSDLDAAGYLARTEGGSGFARLTKTAGEVAGRPATIVDVITDDQGLLPAGFTCREYVVDTGAGALTIQGQWVRDGEATARHRAEVDAIALAVRPA